MAALTANAQRVLEYLVATFGPEDWVTDDQVARGTWLQGFDLQDALHALKEAHLIQLEERFGGVNLQVLPRAWTRVEPGSLGFDPQTDAEAVVQAVQPGVEVDSTELAAKTDLPVKRLNVAVLLLRDSQALEVSQEYKRGPYAFSTVKANEEARRPAQHP